VKRSRIRTGHKRKIFELYRCRCGYTIEVARVHATLKEYGHKKTMYCPRCEKKRVFLNKGVANEKRLFRFLLSQ
jgi:hypothetical protein